MKLLNLLHIIPQSTRQTPTSIPFILQEISTRIKGGEWRREKRGVRRDRQAGKVGKKTSDRCKEVRNEREWETREGKSCESVMLWKSRGVMTHFTAVTERKDRIREDKYCGVIFHVETVFAWSAELSQRFNSVRRCTCASVCLHAHLLRMYVLCLYARALAYNANKHTHLRT